PLLASTGGRSHVGLFSFYALLNLAILFIAWFKPWRSLNLLGFLFTFVIGVIWGNRYSRPEYFASTEPVLILFFLFYVANTVLFALRQDASGDLGIEIGWVPHKLVFAARGSGPFQLAYGSSGVKPAALAIDALIPGYKTKAEFKVALATLGAPVTLAGVSRLSASRDFKTLMLWGSLILGVTVLGWMALRLSRQVSNPPAASQTTENSH
ncbi:MAG: DUF2339 domain-containing protein, partial [Candidatus Binatia bacterium]